LEFSFDQSQKGDVNGEGVDDLDEGDCMIRDEERRRTMRTLIYGDVTAHSSIFCRDELSIELFASIGYNLTDTAGWYKEIFGGCSLTVFVNGQQFLLDIFLCASTRLTEG